MLLGYTLLYAAFCGAATQSLGTAKPSAEVEQFNALPATCITLRQGRKCFTNVTISLKISKIGDYCVYQQGGTKPIRCWQKVHPSNLSFTFESAKKVVYELREQQSQEIIAQTAVEVSWVHQKTSRKRRWRIF